MADPGSLNDALFMPPQHGNTFDFALAFEHGMFTILPASLLIIITPLLLYYYTRRPIMVDYGWLFCAKIVCAICLLSIKVSILMLWIKCVHNTMLSIIASSIDCGAALCAAIILGVEHRYSFRPSSVLSVYFTLTILFDIAMARSCIRRSNLGLYTQGLLFILSAAFRGVLLILQERSKRRRIIDPDLRNSLGAESISNFWSRSLLIWLNKTLFLGFQKVLELDDLEDLGPELLSTHLNERFSHIWASTRKDSTHCLAKACIKSLIWPAFTIIIPRLSFTAFIFSQPLLLLQIVHFLGEAEQDISPSYAYGLIGATVIVYLGIVVSRALYTHLGFCLVTSARGILMSQILRKSLTLEYSKAKQNAAVTLISTDIESITSDLPRLIEFTVSSIEVGVGIYLLNTVIGNAAFLIFIPFLIFTLGAKYIGARMSPASISWNEKTQHRVSQIALVMKHITGIKILGLDSAIMEYFQHLRIVETKALQKFRMLGLIVVTMVNFGVAVTPVIVIAGIIFLPSSTRFSAAEAFTTISIILSLTEPLGLIISGYSRLRMILACLQRIQAFLLQDERKDNRTAMPVRPFLRDDFNETAGGSATPNYNIALLNSDIIIQAWQISIQDQSADRYLLKDASFAIQKSTLTIIKGAIGSGKSLLLRAILGEVNFEGTLSMVDTGMIAYYDQTPWIRYASIRDNIVGNVATYDAAWYNTVVEACFLTNDLLQLPEGDNTLAGSEGVSLSGGQKQRVALARAIYSQAEILVLDDPLSGLDQYTLRGIVSNLFGAEGILKQLQTTVIIATHSAYYTEFASMIISLDGIGNLATTQLTRGAQQSEQAISTIFDVMEPSADGFIHAETNSITESDTDVSEKEDAETLRLIEAQEDTLRRKDDLALYLFYIRSTKRWMVMVWFVAVTLTTLSETFPTVYVRIWLEVDANNNIYFVGYAFLGLLCCILTAVTIWFYFTHVITNSINTLHKKLLDTMLRFSQDISLASRELPRAAFVFVYSVSQTTFAVVVILSGARFAAAFLPLIILMLYVFQHFYLRISRQMRYLDLEAKTPLYTHLAETATGIYHIRSYGVVAEVLENGLELLDISQKPFYYMFCIQRWMLVGTDMVSLGVATILVSFAVLRRDTSQAAIGLSLANLVGLSYYTSTVIQTWTDLGTSLGAIARIRNFSRDTPIEQEINEETPQDWPQQGHIVLSNLTAIYSSTDVPHEVLRDISLEIMPGQKISIIGRTGSGKSSLLLAILNFLDCTGSIYIDGRDIATISQRKLRSKITTITQTPISLNASTRYNLLPFQLERDNEMSRFHDAEAVEVLCRIRLWHHIATHGGLDAPISAMGFSSGQLQILSIARAILHHRFTNSKVILIDEPTSSIDADMEAHIKEVLHEAFDSCTVLIVTHRLETVTQSDMILELEEGQVVRFGPPDRPSRSMSSFRYTSSLRSMSSSRSMSSFG